LFAVRKDGSNGDRSRDGIRTRISSSVRSGIGGVGEAGGLSESSSSCSLRFSMVGMLVGGAREQRLYGERNGCPDAILTLNPSRWAPDVVSSCGLMCANTLTMEVRELDDEQGLQSGQALQKAR